MSSTAEQAQQEQQSPTNIKQSAGDRATQIGQVYGPVTIHIYNLPEMPSPLVAKPALPSAEERVPECPYRGLFAFRPEHAQFFFGRETFTAKLVQAIESRSLVAVLGASGSGKSSVVFAGLVPELDRSGQWRFTTFRPGDDPFMGMANALVPLLEPKLSKIEQIGKARDLATRLHEGRSPLADYLNNIHQLYPDHRLLIIADQFEELYTLYGEARTRERFLDMLLDTAGTAQGSSPRLVLTLRADFLGQASLYRPFTDALQDATELLGPMTRAELTQAIEKPANLQGVRFEEKLVDRLLDDVGEEEGSLPLLEFALTELWQHQQQRTLTHRAYEEIGRVEGALSRHADRAYQRLNSTEQEQARRIFVQLVNPGAGTEDTRRLAHRVDLEPDLLLVAKLANERLVVTNKSKDGEETVELVHEALIRHWQRLRIWMNQDRAFLTWRLGLRADLKRWQETNHNEGALLRGVPLAIAKEKLSERADDLTLERDLIQASVALEEREAAEKEAQRQRELEANAKLRRRAVWVVMAGMVAIVLAIVAVIFGVNASQSAAQAKRQADLALSRELAAAAIANLEIDPERSILLAMRALAITYTIEAEDALRQALQVSRIELKLSDQATPLRGVAFSPDGTRLAAGGQDKTAKVWDLSKASPDETLLTLAGHRDDVWNVVFSSDGTRLATASLDRTAKVWDVASGEELQTLSGHRGQVFAVAFSPDETRLATASRDKTAKIWDAVSGEALLTLSGHDKAVIGVAFSPDGTHLATASQDETVKVWDSTSGQELQTLSGHTDWVYDVVFSPNGTRLATASQDKTVKIWNVLDTTTDEPLLTLHGHTNTIVDVSFSTNGRCLATASLDKTAKVWDVVSGEALLTLSGHTDWIYGVTFNPKSVSRTLETPVERCGTQLATASLDGTVRMWNIGASRELRSLTGHADAVEKVVFSPNGRYFATASDDGTAKVWNAASGQMVLELLGHTAWVNSVAFSPDGQSLATASYDKTAKVWDAASGQLLRTLSGHADKVQSVAFSADGTLLATTSADKKAKVWEVTSGQLLLNLPGHAGIVYDVAFSLDGTRLVTANEDGTATVWDIASGQALHTLDHGGQVYNVAFSPDGTYLATVSSDATTKLWSVSSGQELYTLAEHVDRIFGVGFSRDGKYLATASADKTVIVWDVASGQALRTLPGDAKGFNGVDFSPDGRYLAAAGEDGTVRLYVLNVEALLALAETRLTRSLTPGECQQYLHQEQCPPVP